ncbi:SDR family NAD(P)-dependent oxidoreductase [Neoaquamicrobium sediminum]|uniref:SDR family NAD(P)-dependent oxidoreductase n=1 Tax=Neoaquamicrobium sediminum TaxID=1849104 RepID=UPI00156655A5|nr:SDR family NAD(P)-dependent oxidoreductase [Mesorhizobium sediminum]NRC57229.1 SDR family oxidoreductase [Mesorhizobium sediminum]
MEKPVAVVTGGGRSLGKAMAERLFEDGFAVAVVDRDEAAAQDVARSLDTTGTRARGFALDVSSAPDVAATLSEIASGLGLPTALINNAGIYPDHALLEMPVEAWDQVMAVNLRGTFLCTQAFARLRHGVGGGTIVNLASAAGFSARAGASHYSTSKAGIVMFTKAAALEFGVLGIRVNAVAPGLIEVRDDQMSNAYRDQYLTMIPRGRTGRAPDIAGTVAFLVSDDADFINGECIVVDGGFLAGRPLVRAEGN